MKPKTILELRDSLLDEMEALKRDPRRINQSKELFNGAGKTLAASIHYAEAAFRHGVPNDDPFMGNLANVPVPARRASVEVAYGQFKKQLPEKTEGSL